MQSSSVVDCTISLGNIVSFPASVMAYLIVQWLGYSSSRKLHRRIPVALAVILLPDIFIVTDLGHDVSTFQT